MNLSGPEEGTVADSCKYYNFQFLYPPPMPPHVLLWTSWSSLLGMAEV